MIRARFIGGFGEIYWIQSREFILDDTLTNSDIDGAINHMNEDHQRAHRHYLKLVYGLSVDVNSEVSMVDLDPEGFVLHYEKVRYRFFFEKQATNMKEIRKELVKRAPKDCIFDPPHSTLSIGGISGAPIFSSFLLKF